MPKIGEVLIGGFVNTKGINTGFNSITKDVAKFFGVSNKQFDEINKSVNKSLASFNKFFSGLKSGVTGTLGPLLKIASVAGLVGSGLEAISLKSTFENTKDINEASRSLGIAVDQLSVLRYTAKQTTVSVGDLESALANMTSSVSDAIINFTPATTALDQLRLSAKTLSTLSPDQAFRAIQSHLARIPDEGKRAAIALEIFGSSAAKLAPIFRLSTSQLAALGLEARKLGIAITEADNNKLLAVQASFSKISSALEGVGNTIAVKLAPYIDDVTKRFTSWITESVDVGKIMDTVIAAISKGIEFVTDKFNRLVQAIDGVAKAGQQLALAFDFSGELQASIDLQKSIDLTPLTAQVNLGHQMAEGYKSFGDQINNVVKGLKKVEVAQSNVGKVATSSNQRTLEEQAKLIDEASKWKDAIRTPFEIVAKELERINDLSKKGYLNKREQELSKRFALNKLNELPRFAGAQELGSAEARSSILTNTSGYVDQNGIPKLVGLAGEQNVILGRIETILGQQRAASAIGPAQPIMNL